MIGKILLLATLALAQGRPQFDDVPWDRTARLWEPHGMCPPQHQHWLLPHEWDCTKFYYCEYGLKYIEPRDCSPGTEFSFSRQVCVHLIFSDCYLPGYPPTNGPSEPETTVYPTSSTTAQSPTTQAPTTQASTTQASTSQSPTTQAPTTQASTTQASTSQSPTTQAPTTQASTTQSPTTTPTQAPTTTTQAATDVASSTQAPTAAPTQSPTAAPSTEEPYDDFLPNGCPASFDVHKLLPHETECNKFYYCVFGETVERTCAPGTYFNYDIQVCDWPHNVNCAGNGGECNGTNCGGDNGENGGTSGESGDNSSENGGNGGECNGDSCGGDTLANGCPADWSVHWLLPHNTDCAKFYYCVHGQLVERDCAPGTHFNPVLQVCDWPQNAGCQASCDGTTCGGSGSTQAPTAAPTAASTAAPTASSTAASTASSTASSTAASTATPTAAPTTSTTAAPTVDPTTASTAAPTAAPTAATTAAPTAAPSTEEPCEEGYLPNGCPADSSVHWLLPHETDCAKFYYCVHGQLVERECAPGTHFNPVLQVCDWPQNAGCQSSCDGTTCGGSGSTQAPTAAPTAASTAAPTASSTAAPTASSTASSTAASTATPTAAPTTSSTASSTAAPTVDPTTASTAAPTAAPTAATTAAPTAAPSTEEPCEEGYLPNGCPADSSIHWLLPHETDCAKFYYCVHGQLVERECAPGTHFNPILQVCDWPQNAGCQATCDGTTCGSSTTTTQGPTAAPTTQASTTQGPTATTTTQAPTAAPTTQASTTQGPTVTPTTQSPTAAPTTQGPTAAPTTQGPTAAPTTQSPTAAPTTQGPTAAPTTNAPTDAPTQSPTAAPSTQEPCDGTSCGSSNEDKCKNECNVLPWAHETDCDKYWACNGETLILITCAEGLHFNSATNTCDFICNAGCVREEVQATVNAQGIKLFLPWDKVDSTVVKLVEYSVHH